MRLSVSEQLNRNGSTHASGIRRKYAGRRGTTQMRKRPSITEVSSDDEQQQFIEYSQQQQQQQQRPRPDLEIVQDSDAVTEFPSIAISGSRKRSLQRSQFSPQTRSGLTRTSHITFSKSEPETTTAQTLTPVQQGLSPIASLSSSTSCIPKSSSSTGPIFAHSPVDYDIQQHVEKANMNNFSDIDERLEAINVRMHNFENDLCNTVDSILELLGQTPKVVREQYTPKKQRIDGTLQQKQTKVMESPKDLEIVLQSV